MSQVSLRSRVSLPHYNISDHLEHLLTPCRLLSTPAISCHTFSYSPFLISSVCAFSSNLDRNRMLIFRGYLPAFNPILFLVSCPLYLLSVGLPLLFRFVSVLVFFLRFYLRHHLFLVSNYFLRSFPSMYFAFLPPFPRLLFCQSVLYFLTFVFFSLSR